MIYVPQSVIKVEGMACQHCINAVSKAVSALSGVSNVAVDLESGDVTIVHDGTPTLDSIRKAIEGQGYDVVG